MNILTVDDEADIRELVKGALEFAGFKVETASNGEDALKKVLRHANTLSELSDSDLELLENDPEYHYLLDDAVINKPYDLIILDEMMPRLGGVATLKAIRDNGIDTPVIFLSAKNSLDTKLDGFNLGADDYILKPFDIEELIARVNVVLSRSGRPLPNENVSDQSSNGRQTALDRVEEPSMIKVHDITINPNTREVIVGDQRVDLTPNQYFILRILCAKQGEVVTKEYIFNKVWGNDNSATGVSIVETYIYEIRKKLKAVSSEDFLETKRGIGYIIR